MRSNFFSQTRLSAAQVTARVPAGRLAFALLASIAAHIALLLGTAWFDLERFEPLETLPLSARIVSMAPQEAAPTATPAAPAKPRVKRAAPRARPVPAEPPPVSETPPPAEMAQETPPPVSAAPPPAASELPAPPVAAEPALAAAIPFPARIDLEFDLARGTDQAPIGRVVHRFERDGKRYLIRSTTMATGIAALFVSGRYVQESRGTLTAAGLRPEHFSVRRGRVERTESADFDWPSTRATVSADGSSRDWTLRAGAQDQLSVLHQMSLLLGAPPSSVMVTNGRLFFDMSMEIVGHEVVETGMGFVQAIHVRSQREGIFRMDVWFAPDYGNLPVKVRMRDRRGEEIEQVLAAMKVSE
jgi:hypothetical protein